MNDMNLDLLLAAAYGGNSGGGGGGGTTNYNALSNKPQINGVTLTGNKTAQDLGIDGSGTLTEDLTVVKDVGGITAGTVYPAGTAISDIIDDMLAPTVNPTLTDPKSVLTYDAPTIVAVGESVPAKTANVSLDRGRINPQYTADEPYRSGAATGYSISVTNSTPTFDDSNVSGSFSVPSFTRSTKGNVTVTATASYGQGCQPKDSSGANYSTPLPAGSKSTTKTIKFVIPFRYGVVNQKDLTDFDGLTVDLTEKQDKKYAFTTDNQYGVIAYDQSYGNLSKIFDQNNFDVTSDWEQHVLGESVYYVMVSPTTDIGAEYSFKF